MTRERVCAASELADAQALRVEVGGRPVALVRIGEDVYAVGDTCSHEDYSLSEGEVLADEREIECWKHGSTFSLVDGRAQCLPASKPVPVYAVTVEDDDVFVEVTP